MRRSLAAVLLAHGCGTSILVSYPTNVSFLRGHSEVITSTRALEDPVQTTRAQLETGPLRVACETTTVVTRVEATWSDTYNGVGRMWCGFMAVGEGAASFAFALDSTNPMRTNTQWEVAAAAYLGADAAGALLYAILAKPSAKSWKTVGPGTEVSQSCPDGIVVRAADQTWPVGRDGSLGGDVHALASAVVAGQAISIAGDGLAVPWTADAHDRCALAAQFSIDDPSGTCVTVRAAPATPNARVAAPLEIRIRLHVPR